MKVESLLKVLLPFIPLFIITSLFVIPVNLQVPIITTTDLANPAWILAYSSDRSKVGVEITKMPNSKLVTIKTVSFDRSFNLLYIETRHSIDEITSPNKISVYISVLLPENESVSLSFGFSYISEGNYYYFHIAPINATDEITSSQVTLDTSIIESIFDPIRSHHLRFQIDMDREVDEVTIGVDINYRQPFSLGWLAFSNYWSIGLLSGIFSIFYKMIEAKWLYLIILALSLTAFSIHFLNPYIMQIFEYNLPRKLDPSYRPLFDAGVFLVFFLLLVDREAARSA